MHKSSLVITGETSDDFISRRTSAKSFSPSYCLFLAESDMELKKVHILFIDIEAFIIKTLFTAKKSSSGRRIIYRDTLQNG